MFNSISALGTTRIDNYPDSKYTLASFRRIQAYNQPIRMNECTKQQRWEVYGNN